MELTDKQRTNLLLFLDRVDYKGLQEVQAINEIILALTPTEKTEET